MRCDGAKPVCGNCVRSNVASECGYNDEPPPDSVSGLQRQIARLENRIASLINPSFTPITLHDPYERYHQWQAQSRATPQNQDPTHNQTPVQTPMQRQPSLQRQSPVEDHCLSEQSLQALFNSFTNHAVEFGFFLQMPRFLQALPQPGQANQADHTVALLNAIYLVGAHFSNDPQLHGLQAELFLRASEHLAVRLINSTSTAVMHALQAEVLLANYCFSNHRTLEGTYHANAAASMALACKLHMIRSSRILQSSASPMNLDAQYRLTPPVDAAEEGERIDAFWTIYVLDKSWSLALGYDSVFADDEQKGTEIDVPWPSVSYENGQMPAGLRTVKTFVFGAHDLDSEICLLALQAKAMVLFEYATRAANFTATGTGYLSPEVLQIDQRIDQLKQSLPAIPAANSEYACLTPKLLLIHMLAHCATIQLFRIQGGTIAISPDSKAMRAISSAASLLRKVDYSRVQHVDAFLGALLLTISRAISGALSAVRNAVATMPPDAARPLIAMGARLTEQLRLIVAALGAWGVISPFMRHQQGMIEQLQSADRKSVV